MSCVRLICMFRNDFGVETKMNIENVESIARVGTVYQNQQIISLGSSVYIKCIHTTKMLHFNIPLIQVSGALAEQMYQIPECCCSAN